MKTLVLGKTLVDLIVNVDTLPKTGDDLVCNKHVISMGGCAYNVATILKYFGIEHDLVSPVGKGIYASIIKEELVKNGYKIYIEDKSADNGYCLCLVEQDGERSFITIPGIDTIYKSEWLDKIDSSSYDNIYISGYEMEDESGIVISNWLINQKDKNIFFGPGPRLNFIDKEIMDQMLKLNPILHLNDDEALRYTNETDVISAAKELYRITSNSVFITLGKDGVLYFEGDKYEFIDGVSTVVENTVGAGDSHIGAILAGISMGYDCEYSCHIANRVAAKVVSSDGSRLEDDLFSIDDYIILDRYEGLNKKLSV